MRIEEYERSLKVINGILNNGGIAEIKIENAKKLVVVEVGRTVRISEEIKDVERIERIERK